MFYERLVALCRLHDTNITEVAVTHLQLASSAPSSWKKGASPRSDVVIRAAQHFGVSTDYLLGLSDNPLPASAPVDEAVQSAVLRLNETSPVIRRVAIAAMDAVIDCMTETP